MTLLSLFFACAPETPSLPESTVAALGEEEFALFTAELVDYDPAADGPLVAELIEQVPGTPPTYSAPFGRATIGADGFIELGLPEAAEGISTMRYRVAVREERADHRSGPIRAMFQPVLVWSSADTEDGAPFGWSVESRQRGELAYEPLGTPGIPLTLTTQPELTLTGDFTVAGIDPMQPVGVALLQGGEVVPGAVGMAVGSIWGLVLDGEPAGFSMRSLRPVAYLESDGELGFDVETEEVIAEACATGSAAFVRWMPEAMDPLQADILSLARATPGWNAWRGEGRRGRALPASAPMVLAESCN